MFVTAQGSPLTRFRRAIQHKSLLLAITSAKKQGWLDLSDALSLVELMAAKHDDLFERAALRWHARVEQEVPGLTLEESALALSALLALRRVPADGAEEALDALVRRHGLRPTRIVAAHESGHPRAELLRQPYPGFAMAFTFMSTLCMERLKPLPGATAASGAAHSRRAPSAEFG
jgi:hypothetical protein